LFSSHLGQQKKKLKRKVGREGKKKETGPPLGGVFGRGVGSGQETCRKKKEITPLRKGGTGKGRGEVCFEFPRHGQTLSLQLSAAGGGRRKDYQSNLGPKKGSGVHETT